MEILNICFFLNYKAFDFIFKNIHNMNLLLCEW